MAEKISMVIVTVDLDCHKCYNKIRKILCQLQDQERIRTISFDDRSKTVTLIGPFDPQRLACKIRCKGGKVVKDVQIVDVAGGKPQQKMVEPPAAAPPVNIGKQKQKKPPATDPQPPPPAEQAPAPAPEPEMPSSPPPQPAPPDRGMAAMVPPFVEEKKPKAKPLELEPQPMPMELPTPVPRQPMPVFKENPQPLSPPARPVEYVIPTVEIPSWPAPPLGPCGCPCCAPCYQGYYESCRCCSCGRVYGYAQPVPAPAGCGYRGCRTFSDEDPTAACSIM